MTMTRGETVWLLVVLALCVPACRSRGSAGSSGRWDAWVTRLYQEAKVGADLTQQNTEASLSRAIRVYTTSIAKADRLLPRAEGDAGAVNKLNEFKAYAYLGRGIAHWSLAEAGVIRGESSASSIGSMIGDTTASIGLFGAVPLTESVVEMRSSGYSVRGRGYVLDTVSKELANLEDVVDRILADGNGAILGNPRQWDGYALKAWGHLAIGNPDGLKFASRAAELEPDLPSEVLTVTLGTLVKEYAKNGGVAAAGGSGSSEAAQPALSSNELTAVREAARRSAGTATAGPSLGTLLGNYRSRLPAE
jgi:hypothetical protein